MTALGEIRTDSSIEDAVWPAGTIMGFAGATPPASWLLCTGLLVPQATWPALYAAIGHKWNRVGGTPTDPGGGMFRLPDLRLSLLVGSSAANAGIRAGSWNHRHASSLTLAHTHGPGTLAEAGHVHGVGSLLVDLHGHSLSRENTIALNDSGTQKDSGQYALDCSSATGTSNQGSGQRALGGTMAGPSSATVSGATAQQSNTAISGSAGPANPPYQTLNYIVKAA